MKKLFGKEYQTPYDKYDLHTPISDLQGEEKSSFDRYHESTNFADSKTLMKFFSFASLCAMGMLFNA